MSELYINNNISAYHWNRDKKEENDYNEINTGLGLELKDIDIRYLIGQYLNSLRKNSNYGLIGYTPLNKKIDYGEFSAGIVAGLLSGYPIADLVPAAGLMGAYENGNFGLNILAVPNAKIGNNDIDGFLGLQAKYKLK